MQNDPPDDQEHQCRQTRAEVALAMQDALIKSRKQFETDAVLEQFEEIMGFVESTLAQWEVERIWVDKICLIVDEAIMNIVRYAYPNSRGRIHISIIHTNLAIQVDIRDTGVNFDPTIYPDPDTSLPLEDRPVGGLGIHFMRRMLDVFQYRREGMYNHLIMKVNTGTQESALEQVTPLDDQRAGIGTLLAIKNDTLREQVRNALSRQRFAIWEVSSRQQLDSLVKMQCGIQLALLDRELVGDSLYEYAHRLKTRQQVPYVYALLLTEEKDAARQQSDQRIDDVMQLPLEQDRFLRHVDVAVKTLDYEYRLLRQRLSHGQALENISLWQNHMVAELAQASEYIQSLLPPFLDKPIRVRWRFTPRSFLGGDLFGYQWLDQDNIILYQMDACGHGFRAAMFTIAVQNMLISRILPDIDRTNPAAILEQLNGLFPMDQFNDMYFSFWAGIYNIRQRRLYYSSGGHPPAILIEPQTGGKEPRVRQLCTHGVALGCTSPIKCTTAVADIPQGSRLYLYTDGIIENTRLDGSHWTTGSLTRELMECMTPEQEDLRIGRIIQDLYKGDMEDDCCLISVTF